MNEIERDAPLTVVERVCAGFLALWLLAAVVAAFTLFGGCASSPSGVKVVASSASYTNIGDINWDEYKIPVLSLYLGPKATVWVNKSFHDISSIEITGTVTNRTEALAFYDSKEQKTLSLKLKFDNHCTTNSCSPFICSGDTSGDSR